MQSQGGWEPKDKEARHWGAGHRLLMRPGAWAWPYACIGATGNDPLHGLVLPARPALSRARRERPRLSPPRPWRGLQKLSPVATAGCRGIRTQDWGADPSSAPESDFPEATFSPVSTRVLAPQQIGVRGPLHPPPILPIKMRLCVGMGLTPGHTASELDQNSHHGHSSKQALWTRRWRGHEGGPRPQGEVPGPGGWRRL